MKVEVKISKKEAQEILGRAITVALFNKPMRVESIDWGYGQTVTLDATDDPEPVSTSDEA